jgi:hypothetical protein
VKKKIRDISFTIRVFLILILYKVLSKLGRISVDTKNKDERNYYDGFCYYQTLTLKVSYFSYFTKGLTWKKVKALEKKDVKENLKKKVYDWESLKASIAEKGLKKNIVAVFNPERDQHNFLLSDGNHRLRCLEDLYGAEHKTKVDIYVPLYYLNTLKKLGEQHAILQKIRVKEINYKTY